MKKHENLQNKYFSFSTFGNIWIKLSIRLEAKNARKLAEIQRFLKENVEKGKSEV